jgi:hypothetical protein
VVPAGFRIGQQVATGVTLVNGAGNVAIAAGPYDGTSAQTYAAQHRLTLVSSSNVFAMGAMRPAAVFSGGTNDMIVVVFTGTGYNVALGIGTSQQIGGSSQFQQWVQGYLAHCLVLP